MFGGTKKTVNQDWDSSATQPAGGIFGSANTSIVLGSARNSFNEAQVQVVSVPLWQAWYKPLSGSVGTFAVFVANHGTQPLQDLIINFSTIPGAVHRWPFCYVCTPHKLSCRQPSARILCQCIRTLYVPQLQDIPVLSTGITQCLMFGISRMLELPRIGKSSLLHHMIQSS